VVALLLGRSLIVTGLTVLVSLAVSVPAAAVSASTRVGQLAHQGGTTLRPRAGEWWFTTWKILPRVWPLTQGAGVTVAVLDSGVQASVPDLRGVVVPGGDVTGHHTNGETDFMTQYGHGTAMSVLIAGQGLGTGMVGVAPKAKILPVTVTASANDLTAAPGVVAAGIRYAAARGAKVIDVSQVYPSASAAGCDPALQAAVGYALARNIVVVAAEGSGNIIGDRPSEPASCAGVLAVGAVQHNRSLWSGDVPEPYLTVVAAGAGLISSGRDGQLVTDLSGARSAAALVSGVAALIRSRYPSMPWYQVIKRMIGTALPEGGRVPNESWGFGIVRMSEVVNAAAFPVPVSTPNPVYARYLAWLATPQGRSVSRQIAAAAAPDRASRARTSASTSRVPTGAILGLILALAVAAILGVAFSRRSKRGGRTLETVAAQALLDPSLAPSPEQEEPFPQESEELSPEAAPESRVFFGVDPQPAHLHLIRPYVSGAEHTAAGRADPPAFDR
jgi:subtilisin family serine protease